MGFYLRQRRGLGITGAIGLAALAASLFAARSGARLDRHPSDVLGLRYRRQPLTWPSCTVRGMEIVEPARVEERAEIPYVGIRVVTPFRGMLAARDRLLAEVRAGIKETGIDTVGYGFLRLHVIDMEGPMDLEAGYFTPKPLKMEHPRIRPGSMAAGRYATLKYQDHARRANQALQDWVRDNDLVLDRRTVPDGDAFTCRYEAFWTDPAVEPRKTRWTVELSMRLAK